MFELTMTILMRFPVVIKLSTAGRRNPADNIQLLTTLDKHINVTVY